MSITWRSDNANNHFKKHHVTFNQAKRVFTAPNRKFYQDHKPNHYDEERFIIIGTVDKHVLFVVFTQLDDEITIISARRLTKRQQIRFDL